MARGDQLGRQWKILQMLIDAKTGRSVADIADRLECHTRTVYRDLIALPTPGGPV
ncbi:MAG: helix-turn-helix domain-containing protein [Desulfobacteraceae bacterium]|jgi:predicted DNA-binding transcriptional regulator YafY